MAKGGIAIKRLATALLLLLMMAAGAAAQTLPGVSVFSPGLVRLGERMAQNPPVHMEAELTIEDAFHARDLSVLRSMLRGTRFVYDGAAEGAQWTDRMRIEREGETLFSAAMTGGSMEINGAGVVMDMQAPLSQQTQALLDFLQTTAVLERAPLAQVEQAILALQPGQALFGGYAVAQAFTSGQTMSDDGTRLTRISIQGSIAREGEAPWVISGYFRQPAGRAPKDTFELTAKQDEHNWLEITYSSLRSSEITKKNRAGDNSVDTTLKVAGLIGGKRISSRLIVYLRNQWTADGDALTERVVVSAIVDHSDQSPESVVRSLNQVDAKMRHEIRITTHESGDDVLSLTDEVTLSVVMDEKTAFDGAAAIRMTIGGEVNAAPAAGAQPGAQTASQAVSCAVREMSRRIFETLGEETKEKILE